VDREPRRGLRSRLLFGRALPGERGEVGIGEVDEALQAILAKNYQPARHPDALPAPTNGRRKPKHARGAVGGAEGEATPRPRRMKKAR
jgi:hypothetical protein